MQLLEHVAKTRAVAAGLAVPRGGLATTTAEAERIALSLGGPDDRVAVKAQVPIGGRGRAGGIAIVPAREAGAAVGRLLGSSVRGFKVASVLVEAAVEATQELYLAVTVRPATREVVLLVSAAGGMAVEEEAADRLGMVPIPTASGLRPWHVWRAAALGEVEQSLRPGLVDVCRRAYDLFWQERAELIEINPLCVTADGALIAGDIRIVPAEPEPADDAEALPPELEFDFVVLDPTGRVGLLTTGAGGSMHLIDRLTAEGLTPIDFCDLRTGRPRGLYERLSIALRRLREMPNIACLAINFFAGVTILDEIMPILVAALAADAPPVPIVARLEGRGAEAARRTLSEVGVRCATSLDELIALVGEETGDRARPERSEGRQEEARHNPAILSGTGNDPACQIMSEEPVLSAAKESSSPAPLSGLRPSPPNPLSRKQARGNQGLWALLDRARQGVIVQGMTGQIGRRHTSRMRQYGTPIVAGVTPGRGGTSMDGVPVFDTVAEAVEATGAQASIAFLPGAVAADGIVEAAEAGIGLIACPTEGAPLHDMLRALERAQQLGTRVIGPNTGGLLVPDRLALGFLPSDFARPGPCAVISRSGTLSYETVLALSAVGLGVSVWIGVGGDRVKGSTFADLLPDLLADDRTGAVVLLGEIGGTDEEDAAALLVDSRKPVVALLAGRAAPPGVAMGHAGAIVNGRRGSYESKREALVEAGVMVAASPTELAALLHDRLP